MANITMTNSSARATAGTLAGIALAGTLAVLGCTTNLNPGSGEPGRGEPGLGPSSPTSTPGTSYGANGPMTSAYNADVSSEAVHGPMISASMAGDPEGSGNDYRMKVLGRSDPAPPVKQSAPVNRPVAAPATTVVLDDAEFFGGVAVTANGTVVAPGATPGSVTPIATTGAVTTTPTGTTGVVTTTPTGMTGVAVTPLAGGTNVTTVTNAGTGTLTTAAAIGAPAAAIGSTPTLNTNATTGLAGSAIASSTTPSPVSRSTFVPTPTISSAANISANVGVGTVTANGNTPATTVSGATTSQAATAGTAAATTQNGVAPGSMASSSVTTAGTSATQSTTTHRRPASPVVVHGTSRVRISRDDQGRIVVTNQQP